MNKLILLNPNDGKVKSICKDTEMIKLVNLIGEITLNISENRFENLVKSIIGQLISPKSASTIFQRLSLLCEKITPYELSFCSDESLRNIGISRQKVSYIRNLISAINSKELDLNLLDNLNNEEVITMLTKIKGIGKWTAEMYLIFSLCRMNVLSLGDVGLQRACKWLYRSDNGKEMLLQKSELWKPNYTVASLYLWESVNKGFVVNFQSIDDVILSKKI